MSSHKTFLHIHIDTCLYTHRFVKDLSLDLSGSKAWVYCIFPYWRLFFLIFFSPSPIVPALFFLIFFSLSLLLFSFSFSFEIMVSLCYSWVAIIGFTSMCHHERLCSYLLVFSYVLILWMLLNSLPFIQGQY